MCCLICSALDPHSFFSLFSVQVWFQNRRARTLKCKGAKKALWQSDTHVQEVLPSALVAANMRPQLGPIPLPPQGPPPAYPIQVKEEMDEACYYGQNPPAYSSIDEHGHYSSMYGRQKGRLLGSSSSPPLRGYWSQPGSQTSPHSPLWCHSPLGIRNYSTSSGQAAAFVNPTEQQTHTNTPNSHSSTPDTPDSGYWDVSPPQDGHYSQLEDSWSGVALEGCVEARHPWLTEHAPLPELSLQEILGELDEDWLGGEGLGNHTSGEKMSFC